MNPKFSACIVAVLAMILIGQCAFAESAKTTQAPAKKGKNLTIKLFESMTLDSGDKKPADKDKKTTAKKETKKVTEKKPAKKVIPKKPAPKKPTPKVIPKKPVTTSKHDTAKNSISNVR